jgi:hypothetical protein
VSERERRKGKKKKKVDVISVVFKAYLPTSIHACS